MKMFSVFEHKYICCEFLVLCGQKMLLTCHMYLRPCWSLLCNLDSTLWSFHLLWRVATRDGKAHHLSLYVNSVWVTLFSNHLHLYSWLFSWSRKGGCFSILQWLHLPIFLYGSNQFFLFICWIIWDIKIYECYIFIVDCNFYK